MHLIPFSLAFSSDPLFVILHTKYQAPSSLQTYPIYRWFLRCCLPFHWFKQIWAGIIIRTIEEQNKWLYRNAERALTFKQCKPFLCLWSYKTIAASFLYAEAMTNWVPDNWYGGTRRLYLLCGAVSYQLDSYCSEKTMIWRLYQGNYAQTISSATMLRLQLSGVQLSTGHQNTAWGRIISLSIFNYSTTSQTVIFLVLAFAVEKLLGRRSDKLFLGEKVKDESFLSFIEGWYVINVS